MVRMGDLIKLEFMGTISEDELLVRMGDQLLASPEIFVKSLWMMGEKVRDLNCLALPERGTNHKGHVRTDRVGGCLY